MFRIILVAIVQLGLYIILRTLLLGRGLYIVHETGRRQCSGLLSNLVCRRRRLLVVFLRWHVKSGSLMRFFLEENYYVNTRFI